MDKYSKKKYSEKKNIGNTKMTFKCDPFAAQKSDMNKVQVRPMDNRGTPSQAFGYKY
jgi:hypothetical protein